MLFPIFNVVVADDALPSVVIAAGVPRYMGETRDYDRIFAELADAGITVFVPFSQYQQLPEQLALDYETDFLPPCTPESPAFAAMRTHSIRLLTPGSLLYATEALLPPGVDPLRALIDCIGEDNLFGVLNIDEPVNARNDSADPVADVRRLYERVKAVAPDMFVLMVHAPLPHEVVNPDGSVRPTTQDEIDGYLDLVIQFSVYADMIGFDVYPIPASIGAVPAPGLGTRRVSYEEALPAYLDWLRETAEGRPIFMVLQGFGYERMGSTAVVQEARDAGVELRFPTYDELRGMACLTTGQDASIAWWGQSHLIQADADFWESLLDVSQGVVSDAQAYCR